MATRSKEKAVAHQENADKRPTAIARYIRISPFKVRIVLDMIRGKKYAEARFKSPTANKYKSALTEINEILKGSGGSSGGKSKGKGKS